MRALRSLKERDRKLIRDVADHLGWSPSLVVSRAVKMLALLRSVPGSAPGRPIT